MFHGRGGGPSHGEMIPLHLRANDIKIHLQNIDSRFRDTPARTTTEDFYYTLPTTIRNVLRLRLTSIEFPNNYYFFTAARKNVSFLLTHNVGAGGAVDITIADGNYSSAGLDDDSMVTILTGAMTAAGLPFSISVDFTVRNGKYTFTSTQPFSIDTTWKSKDRPYDYGLGYYLGFSRGVHKSTRVDTPAGTRYVIQSDGCAYFAADNYVFLRINDYGCIRQTVRIYDGAGTTIVDGPHEFTAMAKIVLRDPKNYMNFEDYSDGHIKEVVLPSPVDIGRLHIQIVDQYGDPMDLCFSQVSFSIEITEVLNSTLYNTIRDSLAVQYL
jgi:hypothetical protein